MENGIQVVTNMPEYELKQNIVSTFVNILLKEDKVVLKPNPLCVFTNKLTYRAPYKQGNDFKLYKVIWGAGRSQT